MCSFSRSKDRIKSFDFTLVTNDGITFMSPMPDMSSRDWLVLRPFSSTLWYCFLLAFLTLSTTIYAIGSCLTRSVNCDFRTDHQISASFNGQLSIENIVIKLLTIILGQEARLNNIELSQIRRIYAVWIMVSLILSNAYVGRFYSVLSLPDYEDPLDTVPQLVEIAKHDIYPILTYFNSSYMAKFIGATPEEDAQYEIGQHINRTNLKHITNEKDIMEHFSPTNFGERKILVTSRLHMEFLRRLMPMRPVFIASENLSTDHNGFIFAKKSALFYPFSKTINYMQRCGLINFWINELSYRWPAINIDAPLMGNPTPGPKIASLNLEDICSIFYILIAGILISFVVFIVEVSIGRIGSSSSEQI